MPGPLTITRLDAPSLHLNHEVRPARYLGPRGACHPDALELCVIEQGSERSRLDGRLVAHAARECVLIPPGVEHSSWTEDRPVRECILHVPSLPLQELAASTGLAPPERWAPGVFRTSPEILAAVEAIKREASGGERAGQGLLLDSLAVQLGVALLRRHGQGLGASPEDARDARARLRAVEERMRTSLGEPFALDELARSAGLSRWGFLRAFKKLFGRPPHAHLLHLRVEEAARRIRASTQTLTEIALDLGFGSSSRLTEAFRRVYGVPPSAWRRAAISGK